MELLRVLGVGRQMGLLCKMQGTGWSEEHSKLGTLLLIILVQKYATGIVFLKSGFFGVAIVCVCEVADSTS